MSELPPWVTPVVAILAFAAMAIGETIASLRLRREPRAPHTIRNLATGGLAAAIVLPLQLLILVPAALWIESRGIGLLALVSLPSWIEIAIAFLLLDYTLWWWHRFNHTIPFLWRFHLIHHIDLDLDASTAFRFHFGELTLSVLARTLQIAIIGASPVAVSIWQAVLFVSILFHHSNMRLPVGLERFLVLFIVTPRMHGIHHSNYRNETDSNWSSILSLWDRLQGTLVLNVPQQAITIGVPAYDDPSEVGWAKIQLNPFLRQRDDWDVPDHPETRPHSQDSLHHLSP